MMPDRYNELFREFMKAPEPKPSKVPTKDSQNALGRKPFDPNKASIAEAIMSIAPILGDVLSAKDTAASLSEGNYGEAALNGVGLLPFVPSLAKVPMVAGAIKAFHGTPHTFKPEPGLPFGRFKKEAIGTGEGAAAYGHGASYSAESPAVAEQYRKALSENDIRIDGKRSFEWPVSAPAKDFILMHNGNLDNAISDVSRVATGKDYPASTRAKFAPVVDELSQLKEQNRLTTNSGHTLELSHEWPDAAKEARTPLSKDDLLDWDKPLSEQSEGIKAALQQSVDDIKGRFSSKTSPPTNQEAQALIDAYRAIHTNAEGSKGIDLYDIFSTLHGGKRQASEYLHSLGIPGIKYLDGTSRGAGEGTHNFVMFEPEYTKIVARDGIPAKGLLSE